MPATVNHKTINVSVSKEMAEKIDKYRNQIGLTRSAFCAYVISQNMMAMDKAFSKSS